MRTTSVAHKYAKALFDASIEAGRTQKIAAGVASIRHLEEEEPSFLNFLTSPEVLTERKTEFILTVFGPRLDEMVVNFLRLLVDKKRIGLLSEISRAVPAPDRGAPGTPPRPGHHRDALERGPGGPPEA